MMEVVSMPRLGQTMDAGVLVRLDVGVGESFDTGDLLYVVETEKVEVEVEAKRSGRLARWLVDEGDEVPVGDPLAVIADQAGEMPGAAEIDQFLGLGAGVAVADADLPAPGSPAPLPSPAPVTQASATGSAPSPARPRAMPRARVIAREHGVDLADVTGSGDLGSISVADMERHLAALAQASAPLPAPVAAAPAPPSPAAAGLGARVEPLTGQRRAMFASMTKSWTTIPHFVESICIDATNLMERRRVEPAPRPTITAYLIEALAAACREYPILHAESVPGGVRHRESVSVSVATDTDMGLVAPVLAGADQLDVRQIHTGLVDLAERARERRLTIDEVGGAGVTVSSLGAHGVEIGTPIIPPGQTSMLFAGAIKERPVVVDGLLAVRSTMWLTMACDHRLIDGATAARALDVIRTTLGDPRQ